MREKCFIDTTVLLDVILQGEMELLEKLSGYLLHTSVNVLEETGFKIIIASVLDSLGLEKTNFYRIKDAFERGYGGEAMLDRLHALNFMKNGLIVLPLEDVIFDDSKKIIEKYRLLPNDALIAATCKHYGIKKIATFDDDFKRVDFLEIVKME
ncbi:PIN domain nuclease [Archaeoglobales archaeon]|nr:MAG: PIN domain nuclease [Archaeoglobales archaeon]